MSSAITAAALRQLADLGYANVSMESVAIEAGVARATIYRRYRDKADLITAAIAANSSARLVPGSETDPRADLIECLEEFDARFAESCLEVVGTLIGARDDPGAMALHRERVVAPRLGYIRNLLERARKQGLLGPDADVELAIQMLTGSVFARRIAGIVSPQGWAARAVDTIFAGKGDQAPPRVAAPPAAASTGSGSGH